MDHPGTSKHRIGSFVPQAGIPRTGRGQARVGPWAGAGLLAGGCLGCGYGVLAGLTAGIAGSAWGFIIGGTIGLIAGPLTGFLIGLAQVLLRRTAIPAPVIAAAVTEMVLLPPQLLAAGVRWQQEAALFVYIPSMLGIGTAVALGFLLPPAKRPLRRRSEPGTRTPQTPGTLPFGTTGLRLRAYRHRPHRRAGRPARDPQRR